MSFVQIDPSQTELLQQNLFELTRVLQQIPEKPKTRKKREDVMYSIEPMFSMRIFPQRKRIPLSIDKKVEEVSSQVEALDDIDRELELLDKEIERLERSMQLREESDPQYETPSTPKPQSDAYSRELDEVIELSGEVQCELIKGKVNEDQLVRLNKKLEGLKINYGNVAGVAVAAAAVISGVTDLLDLIKTLSGQ